MKSLNEIVREMTAWGTPACGVFCGVIGGIAAVLMLTIGFWQTMLVAALCAAGAFIGGVKDKAGVVKGVINRVFPPRDGV